MLPKKTRLKKKTLNNTVRQKIQITTCRMILSQKLSRARHYRNNQSLLQLTKNKRRQKACVKRGSSVWCPLHLKLIKRTNMKRNRIRRWSNVKSLRRKLYPQLLIKYHLLLRAASSSTTPPRSRSRSASGSSWSRRWTSGAASTSAR